MITVINFGKIILKTPCDLIYLVSYLWSMFNLLLIKSSFYFTITKAPAGIAAQHNLCYLEWAVKQSEILSQIHE